jgi:hypothetical protein
MRSRIQLRMLLCVTQAANNVQAKEVCSLQKAGLRQARLQLSEQRG